MGPQNQTGIFSGNGQQIPPEAFTWGQGGVQLTPEQVAGRQHSIDAERAAGLDFSPVGSWTQGMARVANALLANRDQRRLDDRTAQSQAAQAAIVAELSKGAGAPNNEAMVAALMSPDAGVQKLGQSVWERQNPKPVNNDSAQDWALYQQNLTPEQFEKWKANRVYDPPHFAALPNGQLGMVGGYEPPMASPPASPPSYAGPPGTPAGMSPENIPMGSPLAPPATLPPDFDFGEGR